MEIVERWKKQKEVSCENGGVTHQTGLVQWTWKITSISNDPDAKDEHDGASS